jgi:hypothetical protein
MTNCSLCDDTYLVPGETRHGKCFFLCPACKKAGRLVAPPELIPRLPGHLHTIIRSAGHGRLVGSLKLDDGGTIPHLPTYIWSWAASYATGNTTQAAANLERVYQTLRRMTEEAKELQNAP